MTPDPTTRDPAASLRACIERVGIATAGEAVAHQRADGSVYVSIGDYRTGPHAKGDVHLPHVDVAAMTACLNWCRDAAPALLAEVGKARAELAEWNNLLTAAVITPTATILGAEGLPTLWPFKGGQDPAMVAFALHTEREARKAAEKVAREAVELVRRTSKKLDAYYKQSGGAYSGGEPMQTLAPAIATFLAHHGARTGEQHG